jgi:lipopolysaccharide assembly outer membrane protein LptD (OstA)
VSDDEMKVWGSNYTTCDLKVPHYHFRAEEMKVYPGDKVITGPIWLYIGETPIAYLPFMAANLRRGRRSGILRPEFEFGFDRQGGRYIRNWGYYWATNDYTDFGFRGDFNEEQSLRLYTENRYALRYRFTGGVRYNFFRNLKTNRNEWELSARHNHTLGERFSLTGDARFVSSDNAPSSINRIDDVARVTDRAIRSNVSLRKQWDTVGFSASASRQQNLSVTAPGAVKVSTTAPDVTLSIPSRNLFFGKKSQSGKEGFWERTLSNTRYSPSLSGRRTTKETEFTKEENVTINQGLGFQSPQRIGFLTVSPSLRASNASTRDVFEELEHSETSIDNSVTPADTTTSVIPHSRTVKTDNRFSWNTGASMSTNFYGTFYPKIGRLRGIRHTISPQASWTYTPAFGNEGPARQGFAVSLRQSLDLKVLARDAGEETAAGAPGAPGAPPAGPGEEEERVNKLSGVVLWTLTSAYNPKAPRRQGWSTISSSINTSLLGTSVSMNQRIDPYELDVQSTTVQSGVRFGGTHPFGRSSSVTIRELNVVAAHDTSGQKGRAPAAEWEETGEARDRRDEESALAIEEGRLPWSLSADISYTKSKNFDPRSTLQLNGEIELTPAWTVSYSTTYDVQERLLLGQNYRITRDLHCWEMSLSRQQLGNEWQFYFRINLKAHEEIYAEQGRRGLGGGTFGQGSFGF